MVKVKDSDESQKNSEPEMSATQVMIPFSDSDPFSKDIATDDLFSHQQLLELQSILRKGIETKMGTLITGPAGSGKTTAARSVTDLLPANKYSVAYMGQDRDGTNVLRRFVGKLGLPAKCHHAHLTLQASRWLSDNLESGGKQMVLVVDEAHLLSDSFLEDLRLFTNAEYDRKSPLALVLLGHQSLRLRLKSPDLDALYQRLRYRFRLEGLNQAETVQYINRRLLSAGLAAHLFSEEALLFIFQATEGLPRRINNICSLALLKARTANLTKIDVSLMQELDELD
jgi:type II secretory pathway predicted ATPase ExeA